MSNTVLLIHGAWLNSRSWDAVKARYEARGFTVVAPDWPYDDRSPEDLRAEPDEKLATLGIAEILDHYQRIIGQCPEEPILIGHSAGGVFVQHLLDRGLGVAGVAVDPAPTPRGAARPARNRLGAADILRLGQLEEGRDHVAQILPQPLRSVGAGRPGRRALRQVYRADTGQGLLGRDR